MSHKNEQTVAHRAADIADSVVDGVRHASHNIGEQVRQAGQTAQDAGNRAASAVGETCVDARQFARDSLRNGRDRVQSWENTVESCMRDHPKSVLLVAVALGALLVAWWDRR